MATHKGPPKAVIAVVVLLLLGGAGWFWWQSQQQAAASANTATGSVEANDYQVAAAIAGRITSVKVAEGDTVAAGDPLVKLDNKALKLQVTQAEQGVKAAEAAVKNARDDGTKADVAAANARVKQAKAAVDLAKLQLGYATVTAPHAGTVVTVTANAGQNTSPGKTLVTLTDPADLFVRVFVAETSIGDVKVGQAVKVTTDSSSTVFEGKVTFVNSAAEFTPNNVETKEQRVKLVYEVRVSVTDNTGTLKAGLPVDVAFQ